MNSQKLGQDLIFLLTRRQEFVYSQVVLESVKTRSKTMKNPLDSVMGTIISGFILTLILYFIVSALV